MNDRPLRRPAMPARRASLCKIERLGEPPISALDNLPPAVKEIPLLRFGDSRNIGYERKILTGWDNDRQNAVAYSGFRENGLSLN